MSSPTTSLSKDHLRTNNSFWRVTHAFEGVEKKRKGQKAEIIYAWWLALTCFCVGADEVTQREPCFSRLAVTVEEGITGVDDESELFGDR